MPAGTDGAIGAGDPCFLPLLSCATAEKVRGTEEVEDKLQGLSLLYTLRVVTTCHSPSFCDMSLVDIAFSSATLLKNKSQASNFLASESPNAR